MGDYFNRYKSEDVDNYVNSLSAISGLNLSEGRTQAQIDSFRRLLKEANDLNSLVTERQHIAVTPITVLNHKRPD